MFEDVISDIQDSIGRLHHEIEARRKGLDDALDANQSPEARREEPARMQEEMKRLLGKCCRSFRALTERL